VRKHGFPAPTPILFLYIVSRAIEGSSLFGKESAMNSESVIDSVAPVASIDRTEINRSNAQHSTGPRTPEGKAISNRNALRHGYYSEILTRPNELLDEQDEEFEALRSELVATYDPQDPQERDLVESLSLLKWRLVRLRAWAQACLVRDLENELDPLEAVIESERIGVPEARLERSIVRLHKDLLFLARYRQRNEEADARRQPRQAPKPASESPLAEPAPAEKEDRQQAVTAAPEPQKSTAPSAVDSWLSPYEIERRKRLLWKPTPDAQPGISVQPASAGRPGA
jgi:hypothetical protein